MRIPYNSFMNLSFLSITTINQNQQSNSSVTRFLYVYSSLKNRRLQKPKDKLEWWSKNGEYFNLIEHSISITNRLPNRSNFIATALEIGVNLSLEGSFDHDRHFQSTDAHDRSILMIIQYMHIVRCCINIHIFEQIYCSSLSQIVRWLDWITWCCIEFRVGINTTVQPDFSEQLKFFLGICWSDFVRRLQVDTFSYWWKIKHDDIKLAVSVVKVKPTNSSHVWINHNWRSLSLKQYFILRHEFQKSNDLNDHAIYIIFHQSTLHDQVNTFMHRKTYEKKK